VFLFAQMRGRFRGRDAACAWLNRSWSEEGAELVVLAREAWSAASAMLSFAPLIAVIEVCLMLRNGRDND
jgi:hypothetical protein